MNEAIEKIVDGMLDLILSSPRFEERLSELVSERVKDADMDELTKVIIEKIRSRDVFVEDDNLSDSVYDIVSDMSFNVDVRRY